MAFDNERKMKNQSPWSLAWAKAKCASSFHTTFEACKWLDSFRSDPLLPFEVRDPSVELRAVPEDAVLDRQVVVDQHVAFATVVRDPVVGPRSPPGTDETAGAVHLDVFGHT